MSTFLWCLRQSGIATSKCLTTDLESARMLTPMPLASPLRSPTLGAPIILSPSRHQTAQSNGAAFANFHQALQLTNSPTADLNAPLFLGYDPTMYVLFKIRHSCYQSVSIILYSECFRGAFDASQLAAYNPYAAALASPLLAGEYQALDQAGQLMAR